jgi:hypothetical protein
MQIVTVESLKNIIKEDNYNRKCGIYCCVPLYWYKFILDYGFYHLDSKKEYMQTFYCGLFKNYNKQQII